MRKKKPAAPSTRDIVEKYRIFLSAMERYANEFNRDPGVNFAPSDSVASDLRSAGKAIYQWGRLQETSADLAAIERFSAIQSAADAGLAHEAVRILLMHVSDPMAKTRGRPREDRTARIKDAKRLKREGRTQQEIANIMHVESRSTVSRWLKESKSNDTNSGQTA